MADELHGDLVVLLIDVHIFLSPQQSCEAPKSLLEQILYFVSAYLMINDRNHLAVFAVQDHSCEILHLSLGDATPKSPELSNPTRNIGNKLVAIIQAMAQQDAASSPRAPLALSGALSRALCLVHRLRSKPSSDALAGAPRLASQCRPRLLCLVGSPDVPMQYIPVMNAIFSAQRAEVAVDALVLGPPGFDSSFLQQAAHLTGGLYLRAPIGGVKSQAEGAVSAVPQQGHGNMGAALQYLLSCLSADTVTRSMLRVHQPLGVDFRASCFCHKRPLNVGFVCSVCLSIFCTQLPHCAICGTTFTR
mmetsp:Transcript_7435/g.19831  ORF Transcript_7435/g.19831 Transcript_7435/m.19831 type:complete len:304 (-) Transcript_7435:528-1439(-)